LSHVYFGDARSLRDRLIRDDRSGPVLAPLVKLIVVLLLSLGGWGVIWIALSSLRSALL
jgi:hypothetical protein